MLLTCVILAGCSGDDQPPPASPGLSPAASPIPTERPSAPEPSPTVSAGLQALPDDISLNGFVAIDPATGEVIPVWLGADRMWDIDIYPTLTPGRDAVWLSWDNGSKDSVRFDLDGNEVSRVPGVWAEESPNGAVVLYYTSPSEGPRLIARYPDRTVDLGEVCCGVARDDGRVAFLGPFEEEGQSLLLYDPETNDTWVIAEGIGRPPKDGVIYPNWSPSGRFVSDHSIDNTDPEASYWILADTETREVQTGTTEWSWQSGPNGEDWMGELVDGDVVYRDAVTNEEVLRLSVPDTEIVSASDLGGAIEVTTSAGEGENWRAGHVVFDLDGDELGRWDDGPWYISMTPDGPAAARGFVEADCQAIEVDHPRFRADLPCATTGLLWSPDGRFVAYRVEGKPTSEIHIVELDTGDERTYETDHRPVSIEWNHDGSRLVVLLGGGM